MGWNAQVFGPASFWLFGRVFCMRLNLNLWPWKVGSWLGSRLPFLEEEGVHQQVVCGPHLILAYPCQPLGILGLLPPQQWSQRLQINLITNLLILLQDSYRFLPTRNGMLMPQNPENMKLASEMGDGERLEDRFLRNILGWWCEPFGEWVPKKQPQIHVFITKNQHCH